MQPGDVSLCSVWQTSAKVHFKDAFHLNLTLKCEKNGHIDQVIV